MKKLIILTLLISFCGGSAESLPAPVVEVTIVTTPTSSTTTTVLEIIEWEKSKVEIKTCPTAEEIQIDFNHLGKN